MPSQLGKFINAVLAKDALLVSFHTGIVFKDHSKELFLSMQTEESKLLMPKVTTPLFTWQCTKVHFLTRQGILHGLKHPGICSAWELEHLAFVYHQLGLNPMGRQIHLLPILKNCNSPVTSRMQPTKEHHLAALEWILQNAFLPWGDIYAAHLGHQCLTWSLSFALKSFFLSWINTAWSQVS